MAGLSPRVRGSPYETWLLQGHRGSIPACAGEPSQAACLRCPIRVYPRVCGGAAAEWLDGRCKKRSIPACAGEPSKSVRWARSRTVYPRVCGGAQTGWHNDDRPYGLSPRVRGSQLT